MIKNFLIIFSILFLTNCIKKNNVYYCGDHKCKNQKEVNAFFKENLTLEILHNPKKTNETTDLVILNELKQSKDTNKEDRNILSRILNKEKKTKDKILQKKIKSQENQVTLNKNVNPKIFTSKEKIINPQEKVAVKEVINPIKNDTIKKTTKSDNIILTKKESRSIKKRNLFNTISKNEKSYCADIKNCNIDDIAEKISDRSKKKGYPDLTSVR